jgi:Bacteriophage Lambda NinG protein
MIRRKVPMKRKPPKEKKKADKKTKQPKAKLKPLSKLTEEAQRVFNKYIRTRDSEDGYFVCISCGKTLPVSEIQAGHYVPRKNSSGLRFNEYNVHGECAASNLFDQFHLVGYRKNLINKIGQDMVNWLDDNCRLSKKWTRSELEEIIAKYKI